MKIDEKMPGILIKRAMALLIISALFWFDVQSQNIGNIGLRVSAETINKPEADGYKLISSNGNLVGNFTIDRSKPAEPSYHIVLENGLQYSIKALTNVVAIEKANRLVAFGDNPNHCIPHKFDINIYTIGGDPIRQIETNIQYPYVANAAPDGSFYVLGYKPLETGGNGCFLIKYSSSGKLDWEKPADAGMPNELVISDNSQYVSAANYYQSSYKIVVYTSSGQNIGKLEYSNKAYNEFVNNTLFVANDGLLNAYTLKTFSLQFAAKYEGRLAESYPISYSASDRLVLVLTGTGQNTLLQAYNEGNGQLQYKKLITGVSLTNQNFRALTSKNNDIKLTTDSVEYKVTFQGYK